MTFTRDLIAFLTCTAMPMLCHCKADCPPLPSEPSFEWLDNFTVKVFWQKPNPSNREVVYKYRLENAPYKDVRCTIWPHFTVNCLTDNIPKNSDHWTYKVWTVCCHSCNCSNESKSLSVKIHPLKPQAEVEDMKCLIDHNKMNCSWIPGRQSFNLSYRICEDSNRNTSNLKQCEQPYSNGIRSGCYLKVDGLSNDICIVMGNGDSRRTFVAERVTYPPKLKIIEVGDKLNLTWNKLKNESSCRWTYEVCQKKCNFREDCKNFSTEGEIMQVDYDKSCRYEFRARVIESKYCKTVSSDFSNVVSHGTNEPRDETLTVVAFVIPIILSVCIILSCYCFRRHSAIICPIIPDPSAIFKEMMMNGNRELKTTVGSLYTPVPEPIEPCKIALVTENGVLQQNS